MKPIKTPDCNSTLTGKHYNDVADLPVRRVKYRGLRSYEGMPVVTSYWRPSWREWFDLLRGRPVSVTLYGETHAPMLVTTSPRPGEP